MTSSRALPSECAQRQEGQWLLPLVLAATFVLYVGTVTFGFVFDDVQQIVDNPTIRSWKYLGYYFTSPVVQTPYYRPLFTLWLRLNYAVFGSHPAGWHVASASLHVVVTALVFFVARRLSASPGTAFAAALIFGVHPIHVESVAWITGVCDPLYSVFFLAAFLAYMKGRGENATKWTVSALVLCGFSLLSKEPAATFPAIICAYEYMFSDGERRKRVTAALEAAAPFAAVVAVYSVCRTTVMSGGPEPAPSVSVLTVLLTIPRLFWFYVLKLVWPTGLSAFYNPMYVERPDFVGLVLPALLMAGVVGALWLWWRRSRDRTGIAFAALWLLLILAPALYVRAFLYGEAAHDRYLYLPSAGFAVLAAIGLRHVACRLGWSASRYMVAAAILATPLAAMAFSQQIFWASDVLLYGRGVAVAPKNDTVRNNLGRAIADLGRYDKAEAVLTDLVKTAPGNWQAHYNLGYVYYRTNRFADAEAQFMRATEIYSRSADVHLYLGLAQFRLGKLDSADREMRAAIALAPDRSGTHLALSLVLEAKGDLNGALAEARLEMKHSREDVHIRAREEELARKIKAAAPVK